MRYPSKRITVNLYQHYYFSIFSFLSHGTCLGCFAILIAYLILILYSKHNNIIILTFRVNV